MKLYIQSTYPLSCHEMMKNPGFCEPFVSAMSPFLFLSVFVCMSDSFSNDTKLNLVYEYGWKRKIVKKHEIITQERKLILIVLNLVFVKF